MGADDGEGRTDSLEARLSVCRQDAFTCPDRFPCTAIDIIVECQDVIDGGAAKGLGNEPGVEMTGTVRTGKGSIQRLEEPRPLGLHVGKERETVENAP
jgi:hypothetical protein